MKWINVKIEKPKIPTGQYAIKVLVTLHDPMFEEVSPGHGSYTSTALWDGEGFKELCYGQDDWIWSYCMDIPTHWMYLPEPAPAPEVKML